MLLRRVAFELLVLSIICAAATVHPRKKLGGNISIMQAHWQASIRLKVVDDLMFGAGYICSGAVITQRVILTAASCAANYKVRPLALRDASEFTIVMGSIYLYDMTQFTLQYDVLRVLPNVGFNFTTQANDIALFFINGNIPADYPKVQAISLSQWPLPIGTPCTVTSWGNTNNNEISSVLMQAKVSILNRSDCILDYGANNISAGMLCAGNVTNGSDDVCVVGPGGPLISGSSLVGIVLRDEDCVKPGYSGVYTNISYFLDWIYWANSTLDYNNYDVYNGSESASAFGWLLLLVFVKAIFSLFKTSFEEPLNFKVHVTYEQYY